MIKFPSQRQKKAVDNIVSGKFSTPKQAIQAAGLTTNPNKFLQQQGVQAYIEGFEKKALLKFHMSLDDKLMDVYLDGLEATKPYGKDGIEHADHATRKQFADTIAQMKGLLKEKEATKGTQVNFFMFDKHDQDEFNRSFKNFLRRGN